MTGQISRIVSCCFLVAACSATDTPELSTQVETLKIGGPGATYATTVMVPVFFPGGPPTGILQPDATDIYYPSWRVGSARYPVVILLQGANVDKASYSKYATTVAEFGFVVAVPNHYQEIPPSPGGPPVTVKGYFTALQVVSATFAHVKALGQVGSQTPLAGLVDGTKLALLGHSFGGFGGLIAVQGCSPGVLAPPFCLPWAPYQRPSELKAGVFYGTNTVAGPPGSPAIDVNTTSASVALIQGTVDGNALPAAAALTFSNFETPKALATLEGANHYGVTDVNNPAATVFCRDPDGPGPQPSQCTTITPKPDLSIPELDQQDAVFVSAAFTGLFLLAEVKHNQAAKAFIELFNGAPGLLTISFVR